jgi:hypothetical protein
VLEEAVRGAPGARCTVLEEAVRGEAVRGEAVRGEAVRS